MLYFVADLNHRAFLSEKSIISSQYRTLDIDKLLFPLFSYIDLFVTQRRNPIQTWKQQYIRRDLRANVFYDRDRLFRTQITHALLTLG